MYKKQVWVPGVVLALGLAMGASAVAATDAAPPSGAVSSGPEAAAARILFGGFTFKGNSAYSSKTLAALTAKSLGQPLTLKQIKAAAAKIAGYYHAHGYALAQAVVPEQAFANHKPVELVILEGRLGKTKITGNKRFSSERVDAILHASGVEPGKPIKLKQANHALTALNRRAGITATSSLEPGAAQGATNLDVDIKEAPRVSGSYALNDYGSKDTGRFRNVLRLDLADATGRGDELTFYGMKSMGHGNAWYGLADYILPVNNHGTKVEAYVAGGNVDVGGTFNVLDLKGRNNSLGLGVHQDQILSPSNILSWSAWLEGSNFKQSLLDTNFVRDRIRKIRLGVSWDYTRLASHTLATFDFHQGLGHAFGGMPNDSTESSRPYSRADNHFTKITFDVARLQQLSNRWSLMPRIYGQYSFDSLVSGQEFAMGGMNSVMGHPSAVFDGDSGYVASLEARYDILPSNQKYQVIGTLSHGHTHIKRPFIGQRAGEEISGASLGLLATPLKHLSLRFDVGVPIGKKTENSGYAYVIAQYNF